MPQYELGCIIALPLGNLLNKYLAKHWCETNNSFPIIAVVYYCLVQTLTGEWNSPWHLEVKSYYGLSFAVFIFGVHSWPSKWKLWTVKIEQMVKTTTYWEALTPKMHAHIAVDFLSNWITVISIGHKDWWI